jgi:alcohol dehydrogenase class IV
VGIPKILIPTTAGTGSEATRALVLTDEASNTKKVVVDGYLLADVAIIDPLLTLSLPPAITANTGIDALVHAIESYVCVNATPYSDILAIEAIQLIADNLPTAYAKGNNMEARFNMAFAASIAGASFTSSGLGAIHGLSYILGTEYHMPHGKANSIMMPHVMDYNKLGNLTKFAHIAEAMGEDIEGLSLFEAAEESVTAVKRLLTSLDMSFMLPDHNIPQSDLPKLVKGGMAQARLFGVNPRDLTEKDVEGIYRKAFGE